MGYNDESIGYQKTDTSKSAANFNKKGKVSIRQQVRELFKENNLLTVEDVSRLLNRPEISVQPRVSELKMKAYWKIAVSVDKASGAQMS